MNKTIVISGAAALFATSAALASGISINQMTPAVAKNTSAAQALISDCGACGSSYGGGTSPSRSARPLPKKPAYSSNYGGRSYPGTPGSPNRGPLPKKPAYSSNYGGSRSYPGRPGSPNRGPMPKKPAYSSNYGGRPYPSRPVRPVPTKPSYTAWAHPAAHATHCGSCAGSCAGCGGSDE
jgi:hypothetical protein